ncbi:MAG: CRISPR-associated protein Cas4 [Desulfovibrio sp.]|jgi:CRISPR-associated exonuclease Cas4|nr:CRISPR-associated protein Cas4 [Desulfovibrio sp.]
MYSDDDFIQLSAVQHYMYCPRQCALIHLEMVWEENRATTEGRLLHEAVDAGKVEVRGDLKQAAGLLLCSRILGVSGKADMTEFHREGGVWRPFPVEYKRGRGGSVRADSVQVCLQALCLEEMLGMPVLEGAIFYGKVRRRKEVEFSAALREHTIATVRAVHDLLTQDLLPSPANDSRCRQCSLVEQCRPGEAAVPGRATRYLESLRNMS